MPQVKHVVLLRFKPGTSQQQVDQIFAALAGLQSKIPGLLDFSGGPYSSGEGLNRGFTHGFVMTFADEASRDGYLPHPEHEKVKAIIQPNLQNGMDGVVAFDWLHQQ
ncbi:MAG: hypothetical protein AMXMBFR13_43180 [Phycisphaerae bacterium]|jgi:hypothetical protein